MPDEFSGRDRRKFKRLKVDFTVIYRVDRPITIRMLVGDREIEALMLDLSEGGMSILTRYNIPTATILAMRFTFIDLTAYKESRSRRIDIIGDVRYNKLANKKEHRLGICFTQINDQDRLAIADFVKRAIPTTPLA